MTHADIAERPADLRPAESRNRSFVTEVDVVVPS